MSKSPSEIANLKANWASDPCWDLADTDGFEAHRAELQAFEDQKKVEWAAKQAEADRIERQRVGLRAIEFGCQPSLVELIERLEARICELETAPNRVLTA